ncbi:MAG TPA: hypothetical protein VLM76_04720 [Patescibacteria group bacterium]|nr:hypothetical protein [Patescibacteria group bacterium]
MSPDHLLMLADIAQVASERPELDATTVQALYQHLVLTQGGQPTIDQAREYVDRLTSSLGEQALRQRLGLVARRKHGSRASAKPGRGRTTELGKAETASRDEMQQVRASGRGAARAPGRPGWTVDTFREHWSEAIAATPEPRTFASVAPNFRPFDVRPGASHFGVDAEHLSDLYRKHGAPPFE